MGARWQDMVDLRVEVALPTTGLAQFDKARFDKARFSARASWTLVPCTEVVSMATQPNQSERYASTGAASCTIEVSDLAGVWTTKPPAGLFPGLVVRVVLQPKVPGFPAKTLFYGWLEGIHESLSYEYPVATLDVLDAWARVASFTTPPGGPAVGPETTGAMFNHVLDQVSWPAAARVVAAGREMVAVDNDPSTGGLNGQAARRLDDLAWIEDGLIYSDDQGRIVFTGTANPKPPVYVVGAGSGAVCAATFTLQWAADDVINNQIVGKVDFPPQRAFDNASVARHGWRSGPDRTELPLIDNAQAARLAAERLRPWPHLHLTAIELDPEADPDAWPVIANTRAGHTLTAQFPDGTRQLVLVLGVTHEADPNGWLSTVHCAPYPTVYRFDTARFDTARFT